MNSYVYYDENTGAIKVIAPVPLVEYEQWAVTKLDMMSACKFLSGEWDTNQWFVSSASTAEHCILSQNQFDFVLQDDAPMVEIQQTHNSHLIMSAINVTIYTKLRLLELTVSSEAAKVNLDRLEDDSMQFFVTKRNDPSHVYAIITCQARELLSTGKLSFDLPIEAADFSVMTKKIFRYYTLQIKRNKIARREHGWQRFNDLVAYRQVDNVEQARDGILVTHNLTQKRLEISLDGDVHDLAHILGSYSAMMFLTKKKDPTILIDIIKFDLRDIDLNQQVTVKLPEHVGLEFGVSGFPYADKLSFLRK